MSRRRYLHRGGVSCHMKLKFGGSYFAQLWRECRGTSSTASNEKDVLHISLLNRSTTMQSNWRKKHCDVMRNMWGREHWLKNALITHTHRAWHPYWQVKVASMQAILFCPLGFLLIQALPKNGVMLGPWLWILSLNGKYSLVLDFGCFWKCDKLWMQIFVWWFAWNFSNLLLDSHCWELMKSVGSHGSLSLLYCDECDEGLTLLWVTLSHKIMTALVWYCNFTKCLLLWRSILCIFLDHLHCDGKMMCILVSFQL